MALNSASHNPTAEPTGSVSGSAPPVSSELQQIVKDANQSEPSGQSMAGKDAQGNDVGQTVIGAAGKEKTAKELEKERKKAEKLAKFQDKQKKNQQQQQATSSAPAAAKAKEKKPLNTAPKDAYEPQKIEGDRYAWWESRGYFKPQFTLEGKIKPEGKFVIPIPPPNVTGSLHMGHALTNSLQDTMIRHARMKGKTTAWIPGCDHAGIATQSVVERQIYKSEGRTRHDLGRDALTEKIWEWKSKYHQNITNQLKKMGGSMDWSREAFTLDDERSHAVRLAFVQLYDDGIIYRANRLVNWCSALSTSLSNLEVDNKELKGKTKIKVPGYDKMIEFGVLTYFKYPVSKDPQSDEAASAQKYDGYEFIEIATTRPETMLGDVAVAVHPNDTRYKHLVGKNLIHPFLPDRKMTVIADEEVEIEFGTGAVKITPAHDANDFAKGKRHGLEFINILNEDGTLNANAGKYNGQKRFDVRYAVIAELKELGLYIKQEDNDMILPMCSRSKDVVEPVMKPQWWMKMKELGQAANDVVLNGEIKIKPEGEARKYSQWMNDIQDWCLSRQLWWGHRIPAYFVQVEGLPADDSETDSWVCALTEEEARLKAEKKFPGKKFTLVWDEDVLDTWFSAGLWPFSITGWPNEASQDYKELYPTSMLETGWDILFFWVARMIMLGLKLTGKAPFTEVYCHSLIRDSEGRKMSKSLGNVIDPLDIIRGITLENLHKTLLSGNLDPAEVERAKLYQKSAFPKGIEECGADALRFTLVNYTTGGGDIAFDVREIEAKRRFCNKIYQATNFALARLGDGFQPAASALDSKPQSLTEKWILHRYNQTIRDVDDGIENREFSKAAGALYQYWFTSLCDTFIENSKSILTPEAPDEVRQSAQQTLYTALEGGLLLMHPIMPFLTEHLWQKLPRRAGDKTESIMIARFPEFSSQLDTAEEAEQYDFIMAIATGIRSLLAQYGFKEPGDIIVQTYTPSAYTILSEQSTAIKSLGGKVCGDIEVNSPEQAKTPPTGCALQSINAEAAVYLKVAGRIDLDAELTKREKSVTEAKTRVDKIKGIMAGAGWARANEQTKQRESEKLTDAESEVARLQEAIKDLERLKLES